MALTGEQIATLKAAVEQGEYAATSGIVRETLRDRQMKHELRREEIRHLRRLWDEGMASGSGGKLDFAELRQEARQRLKAAQEGSRNAG